MTAIEMDARRAAPSLAALVLLTLVAVAAIDRLFTSGSWLVGGLVIATAAHVLSWVGRRLQLSAVVAVPVVLVAVLLITMWFALASATAAGFPTGGTFTAAIDALRTASDGMARNPFPAPMLPGAQLVGLAAVGTAAAISDVIAFRLRAVMWAAVPSLAVVCGAVAVARPGVVYAWTIVYVAAVGVFWLTHRFALRAGAPVQFSGSTAAARPITPTGVAFTALCVVAAVGIAPLLPRDQSDASFGEHRSVVSPLLSIRALMTNGANVEQFTVRSPVPRSWRLTSLDVYDGTLWSGSYRFTREDGRLKPKWPHPDGEAAHASFSIAKLDMPWIPTIYVPTRVASDADTGWDPRSESLFAPPATDAALRYDLDAVVPRLTTADLRSVGPFDFEKDDLDRYTQLPSTMPEDVYQRAVEVSFGAPTMFDRAVKLQDYFRTFTVGDAPVGHGIDALRSFLFTTHRGTSEQFAAAFAVVARAAGLPARVVVGFAPGEQRADGLWHVEGRHAEAWVELLFARYGWVPFQPMPGAKTPLFVGDGTGGSEKVKTSPQSQGAAVQQDPNGPPVTATQLPGSTPPTTIRPPKKEQIVARGRGVLGVVFGVVVLLALLWVVAVPAFGALRVRWRRRSARTDADAVLVAFAEAVERLADAGCPRRHSETVVEHAVRAVQMKHVGESADDLHALARHTATVLYRGGTTQATASDARSLADRVKRDVSTAAPWSRRVAWRLDPRPATPAGRTWRPRRAQASRPRVHRNVDRKDVQRGR